MRVIFLFSILLITTNRSFSQTTDSTILNLTNQWNLAVSNHDTTKLSEKYSDTISYYGRLKTRTNVLSDKIGFLTKHPDFKQSINSKIKIEKISTHQYKASFTKQSLFDNKSTEVKAYLIFVLKNGHWVISAENDDVTYKNLTKNSIGTTVNGDFDGDGVIEQTSSKISSKGEGEDEIYYFTITFSSKKIKPLKVTCDRDYLTLINEGDLNGIAGDEITVYQPPNHGCTYIMSTYTYVNGTWKLLFEPFLIPTACDELSDGDLQKRIFKEGHTVYFYDTDVNDENFKLVKKKAKIK